MVTADSILFNSFNKAHNSNCNQMKFSIIYIPE